MVVFVHDIILSCYVWWLAPCCSYGSIFVCMYFIPFSCIYILPVLPEGRCSKTIYVYGIMNNVPHTCFNIGSKVTVREWSCSFQLSLLCVTNDLLHDITNGLVEETLVHVCIYLSLGLQLSDTLLTTWQKQSYYTHVWQARYVLHYSVQLIYICNFP